jgi:hypothetical protein
MSVSKNAFVLLSAYSPTLEEPEMPTSGELLENAMTEPKQDRGVASQKSVMEKCVQQDHISTTPLPPTHSVLNSALSLVEFDFQEALHASVSVHMSPN